MTSRTRPHLAREQYAALLGYAESPRGAAKLERDRRKELESYTQSPAKRLATGLGRIFTRGPQVDTEKPDLNLHAAAGCLSPLRVQRAFSRSGTGVQPGPDVVWDADCHRPVGIGSQPRCATPLPKPGDSSRRFARGQRDGDLRLTCLRALQPGNALALQTPGAAPTEPLAILGPTAGQ